MTLRHAGKCKRRSLGDNLWRKHSVTEGQNTASECHSPLHIQANTDHLQYHRHIATPFSDNDGRVFLKVDDRGRFKATVFAIYNQVDRML